MKKQSQNWLKVIGGLVAGMLIIFGGVGNLWRTLKYAWGKVGKVR